MFYFYNPWKHQETFGFLILSRGIERSNCCRILEDLHGWLQNEPAATSELFKSNFFYCKKKKKKEKKKQEKKNKKLIDFLKTKNVLKHKAIAKYS